MTKHVTKLSATGEILIAEVYKDHYEKTDVDPETGKPGKYFVSADEGARVRVDGLKMQLEPGESVILGDEAYVKPVTEVTEHEEE